MGDDEAGAVPTPLETPRDGRTTLDAAGGGDTPLVEEPEPAADGGADDETDMVIVDAPAAAPAGPKRVLVVERELIHLAELPAAHEKRAITALLVLKDQRRLLSGDAGGIVISWSLPDTGGHWVRDDQAPDVRGVPRSPRSSAPSPPSPPATRRVGVAR